MPGPSQLTKAFVILACFFSQGKISVLMIINLATQWPKAFKTENIEISLVPQTWIFILILMKG